MVGVGEIVDGECEDQEEDSKEAFEVCPSVVGYSAD